MAVATRQIWLAALSVLILCACAAMGMHVTRELTRHSSKAIVAKDVIADIMPPPVYLIEMRLVLSQVLEGSMSTSEATAKVERLAQGYDARVKHWVESPPFGLEKHLLGQQHEHGQAFMAKARAMVAAKAAGDDEGARRMLAEAHVQYREHRLAVDKTVEAGAAMARASLADFDMAAQRSQIVLLGVLLLGMVAMLGLSWVLSQTIIRPIKRARDLAQAVAAGDLRQRVEVTGRDEVAELMEALNRMCASLVHLVGDVRRSGLGLAAASEQMAAGSQDLRERADKHQSELKGTSQALKAVTGFVAQNAKAA